LDTGFRQYDELPYSSLLKRVQDNEPEFKSEASSRQYDWHSSIILASRESRVRIFQ